MPLRVVAPVVCAVYYCSGLGTIHRRAWMMMVHYLLNYLVFTVDRLEASHARSRGVHDHQGKHLADRRDELAVAALLSPCSPLFPQSRVETWQVLQLWLLVNRSSLATRRTPLTFPRFRQSALAHALSLTMLAI